ncbi:hypothetical protein [Geothrix oryzisoli]|uniref:hypothetical protein n=1 Tax=Geothrix oryzisoli TaxID=2922721 RepID=UPI001FABB5EF|nr:hypothetical protein [Geothrix oryzisoli]
MPVAAPSAKLQALLKEFQQVAGMAGFLNHGFDPPQLRLQFTLYGRVRTGTEAEAMGVIPRLQAWSEAVLQKLREDSAGAILPGQVLVAPIQAFQGGGYTVVVNATFATKVTDSGYFKVKTAVLAAYQEAVRLREAGFEAEAPSGEPAG